MDIAAAVVGFVGLAGQCLQGCMFLQNFFGDAHDAPQVIQDLCQELRLLITLLKDFCQLLIELQSSVQVPDLTGTSSALNHCYEAIRKLQKFACKHVMFASSNTQARIRNTMKKLQCAWKMSKLRKLCERLHETKTSVGVAQANLLLALSVAQSIHLRQLHQAVLTGLAEQTSQTESILRSHLRDHHRSSNPNQIHTRSRRAQPIRQSLSLLKPSIDTTLNARNLRLLCNIRIVWSPNLADHLSYDPRSRVVTLFDHANDTTIIPLDLVKETILTLSMLFPNANPIPGHPLDRIRTRLHTTEFDGYRYYGDRLRSLQDEIERHTPHTLNALWHDRRNKTQWYTFWLAAGALVPTIAIGVVQCFIGIVHISRFTAVTG